MHTKLCRFTRVIAVPSAVPVNKSLLWACKMTYYPSKRDRGLVFDTNVVENYDDGAQNNPYMVQFTMPADSD